MSEDEEELGRLSTETVEERRARLIPPGPRSGPWRQVNVALLVLLVLTAGVWFGVVPGSSAVGRYPVWSLYELADRIDAANGRGLSPCADRSDGPARVNLLTGRVEVAHAQLDLTADERSMLAAPAYARVSTGPAYDVFAPDSC